MAAKSARSWFAVGRVDLALIAVAAVFVAACWLLAWRSPTCWGGCLTALDVRCWPAWKPIGLALALVQGLFVIRHWPDKKP